MAISLTLTPIDLMTGRPVVMHHCLIRFQRSWRNCACRWRGDFGQSDPVSILRFLKTFKFACNTRWILEGSAMCVMPGIFADCISNTLNSSFVLSLVTIELAVTVSSNSAALRAPACSHTLKWSATCVKSMQIVRSSLKLKWPFSVSFSSLA